VSVRAGSTAGSKRRIRILVLLVMALFTVLVMRAVWLGVVRSSWLSSKADVQHQIPIDTPAMRGAILSSDGQTLADDVPSMEISADPRYVRDPKKVADTVASTIGADAERRDKMLDDLRSGRAYAVLAKRVRWKDGQYLKNLKLDGVHFTSTLKRTYPMGPVGGQVLGFTELDSGKGLEGVESRYDSALQGRAGRRVEIRDALLGQTVQIQELRKPTPGTPIQLSIDSSIQQRLEEVLVETKVKYGAKGGSGVVMDPNTGAIIAMASIPRINANNRAKINPNATQPRSITDPYEPGSVFKVVAIAGALDEGLTTPTTRYNLPPFIMVKGEPDDFKVGESHPRDHYEEMSTTEILQRSSNMGTVEISRLLTRKNSLRKWMVRFGFGDETGIDLEHESAGVVPKLPWNEGQVVNIPFGQGLSATQLQQTRAYAAIANGGELVTPYVVERIGGVTPPRGKRVRILKKRTAQQLTTMLEEVVEGSTGTGVEASLKHYKVAGKTGTAQKVDATTGKYFEDRFRASFIGFVPAEKPALVISIMIDEPDPIGPRTGGEVAAPAFKDVADYALEDLSIPPG